MKIKFLLLFSGYKDNENTPHIFKSNDNGKTWESVAGNLPPLAINCLTIIPKYQDQILFVGTDGGVYGTINGGVSWERVGVNMPIIAVYDIDWNPSENTLIAGTFARSVMTYPLDGIVEGENLSSVNFKSLETNQLNLFPNPVSTYLRLTFFNDKPNKMVQITIFDTNGRVIKQIKKQTAKEVNWEIEVSEFPSGIYLLQVQGERFKFIDQFVKI